MTSYSKSRLVRWLVTKFQPHHTHMQHSQGLNITDVCIMHICIMIKEHMYMHRAYMIKEHMYMHNTYMHNVYMHQSQGLYMHDKYAASWIHASYTHVSGSRIIDVCITHTCIRVKDRRPKIHACIRIMYKCTHHASYICASWPRVSGSRIYASYIHQGQGSYPTPRIALSVGWSVRSKICRIIDTCTIHICMLHYQGPGS